MKHPAALLVVCLVSAAVVTAACGAFDAASDDDSPAPDGGTSPTTTTTTTTTATVPTGAAGADAAPPGDCTSEAYSAVAPLTEGVVCGVGNCRKHVFGPKCGVNDDGGAPLDPCATAYPAEDGANDVDDNCDGVIDEGRTKAASSAGLKCLSCAFGKDVKRLADGTLENKTGPNYRLDQRNTTDCINSSLCKLGTSQWVRNVNINLPVGFLTCDAFCNTVGGTCTNTCSTGSPTCTGAGIGTNLGVYASDYKCVVPLGHPTGAPAGAKLTGSCTDTLDGRVVNSSVDFSVYCCCAL